MPFEIKNTKDFPYFKDFLKHEAACIVQNLVYNKLVMHIKLSWMKSIKRLPLPSETSHDNYTAHRGEHTGATLRTRGEVCIQKDGG